MEKKTKSITQRLNAGIRKKSQEFATVLKNTLQATIKPEADLVHTDLQENSTNTLDELMKLTWGDEEYFSSIQLEVGGNTLQSTESFLKKIQASRVLHLEWLGALTTAGGSFLSHGGMLCAHCLTGVGSATSSLGSISGLGMGLGGHFHADGSWHDEGHHQDASSTKQPNKITSSFSGSSAPSQPSSPISWRLFPENSVSLQSLFSFGPSNTLNLSDFVAGLI